MLKAKPKRKCSACSKTCFRQAEYQGELEIITHLTNLPSNNHESNIMCMIKMNKKIYRNKPRDVDRIVFPNL
jgi:hypothetical protein